MDGLSSGCVFNIIIKLSYPILSRVLETTVVGARRVYLQFGGPTQWILFWGPLDPASEWMNGYDTYDGVGEYQVSSEQTLLTKFASFKTFANTARHK